jgi:hypothetical protein
MTQNAPGSTTPAGTPTPGPEFFAAPEPSPALPKSELTSPTGGQPAAALKLFSFKRDLKRAVPPVQVFLPKLYPGFAPWTFHFRVALSSDMQKKRDEWLALPSAQMNEKEDEEVFGEVCDLLASDPEGFDDYPTEAMAPGEKFKTFAASITDPAGQTLLKSIVRAANNLYWGYVTPREFFPTPANTGPQKSGSE